MNNIKELIEQLEKISGKQVLLEAIGLKQKALVDFLKKNPGATERQIHLAVWGSFPSAAAAGGIRGAINSRLVRRDTSQRPMKYYVVDSQPLTSNIPKSENKPIEKQVSKPIPKISKEELLKQIANEFKSFLGYDDVEINEDSVSKSFRGLGDWIDDEESAYEHEDPDDDNYDPDWREDNDNRIWAPGEYRKYMNKLKEWASHYPWYEKVVFGIETSEKDYCDFTIELKD